VPPSNADAAARSGRAAMLGAARVPLTLLYRDSCLGGLTRPPRSLAGAEGTGLWRE
jgi:hypothetical protein